LRQGETRSVRDLAACAFAHVGLEWEDHVRVDDSLIRGKAELHDLVGDASKAREKLGWSPHVDFEGLVQLLVDADLDRLRAQLEPSLADR
jgi:GDPmannose 4,6-dehydratase